jgi:hypothetical protein
VYAREINLCREKGKKSLKVIEICMNTSLHRSLKAFLRNFFGENTPRLLLARIPRARHNTSMRSYLMMHVRCTLYAKPLGVSKM